MVDNSRDTSVGFVHQFASNNEQRTALQFAFYNTLLFVLLGISLCGLVALYNMLYMFLSPMMWAVLVGTILFPFKKKVTDVMQGWLKHLLDTNTTLLVGLITLPLNSFSRLSEFIYQTTMSQTGVVVISSYALLKILSYERTFMYIISWMARLFSAMDSFILFFTRAWVFPLIVLYFCAYAAWVYVQEPASVNKKFARTLSLPIWIYVLSYISLYFGPFRPAVFGGSSLILALLSAGCIGVDEAKVENKVDEILSETDTPSTEPSTDATPLMEKIQHAAENAETVVVEDSLDTALSGDRLIRLIFSLCALLWIVRHDSALLLVIIPFFFALLKRLAITLGVHDACGDAIGSVWTHIQPYVKKIVDVTVAGPLRQFVRVLFTSDQMLVSSLHSKMDVLSSLVVMILLALSVMTAFIFVGVQLHGETVHLVRLGSNVVSSRPDWLSVAMNYTEDQLEDHNIDIDVYVEQAYQGGRAWLASNVRALADPKDTKRADMLEKQVKQIVDNLYRMWEERNQGVVNGAETTAVSRGDFMTQLRTITDLTALKEELIHIVKDNVDTLMGIAQSVWAVLAVNISVLTNLIGALAGVILGFGMDIINLLIEMIVFLTMVYYLLSASRDRWLPLEWASNLAAVSSASSSSPSTVSQYDVTAAIEHAIFGVFVLSSKMAVFYGLYTYFVHSLFDLNVVFVPSMLAAVFAAIPIMPPYIVCVFGVFELWLVRGEAAAALVFALVSFAPQMFADSTFYKQVKGSHPYVTGLAIIGGMYWLGLQGAIIGPIILCSFLVLVNVYLQFVRTSSSASPSANHEKIH